MLRSRILCISVIFVCVFALSYVGRIRSETTVRPADDVKTSEGKSPQSLRHRKSLRSKDIITREQASREILKDRQSVIEELQTVVREYVQKDDRKGTAKTAIVLLGKLRSVESVPLLVENLALWVPWTVAGRPQTTEDSLPCVGALIEIGMPSVGPVVEMVQKAGDKTTTRCGAYVVKKILGTKLAMAYLADRAEGENNPIRRQRILGMQEDIQSEGKLPP